jgi:hypothetical protein
VRRPMTTSSCARLRGRDSSTAASNGKPRAMPNKADDRPADARVRVSYQHVVYDQLVRIISRMSTLTGDVLSPDRRHAIIRQHFATARVNRHLCFSSGLSVAEDGGERRNACKRHHAQANETCYT